MTCGWKAALLVAALAALVSGFACDNTPRCLPDAAETGCTCNSGGPGYQLCSANGLSLGECLCGSPPGADAAAAD